MQSRAARALGASVVASFAALIGAVYLSMLARGLWEDGYFAKRFAHNFWHHGTFAWNPSDGPVYAITSQALQLLVTALYAFDPRHVVLSLKAALCLSLFGTLLVIRRIAAEADRPASSLVPAVVGLSLPPVLEVIASGLETVLAMFVVALSLRAVLRWQREQAGPWPSVLWTLVVYVTRPDAIAIPIVCALVLSWPDLRRSLRPAALIALGLGLLLAAFHVYYGTALPLPFYVKTRVLSAQPASLLAIYGAEKFMNAGQALCYALPFIYIALHERSRVQTALLVSAFALGIYHFVATVEAMGYLSRFYLPALVPIFIAAALAYPAFANRRRPRLNVALLILYLGALGVVLRFDRTPDVDLVLEDWQFIPFAVACCAMLLIEAERPARAMLVVVATLWAGIACHPIRELRVDDDTTIVVRQIAPRRVFRGLAELRDRIDVRSLFHTDMGAPGVLFPEARVVDLDGLINEDITLRHARFDQLCLADRPDVLFVPKKAYRELRREVLKSSCIKNYRRIDADPKSPLRVRADLLARPPNGT